VTLEHLQQREEHWVFADMVGKGGHVRTIPIPAWVASRKIVPERRFAALIHDCKPGR
jgi:hypothetical protein